METLQKSLHFRVFSYLFRFLAKFPAEKKKARHRWCQRIIPVHTWAEVFRFSHSDFPLVQVYSPIAFTVHTQNST
jgi:hypothetical protein